MEESSPGRNRLQENNFDLVRLTLAMIVCLVHASILSGAAELRWIPKFLSSTMAVNAFFVVSGFLVFMSYDRSSSIGLYAQKRVRRLYPAYFTVIVLCAFGLYAISSTPSDYFGSKWLKYIASNFLFFNFLQPSLPGVFESNGFQAVNGALWSLKIEVSFYIAVPLIAFLFRLGRAPVLFATYVLSLLWVWTMSYLGQHRSPIYDELGRQLPGALCYFVAGAAVYFYLPLFERHVKLFVAGGAAVLLLGQFLPLSVLNPAALGIVVCFLALYGYVGNFGRFGDFSYGLYILHFPILQILVARGWFSTDPWGALLAGVSISMIAAVLMWWLVEKKFLYRSSHYVQATETSIKSEEIDATSTRPL